MDEHVISSCTDLKGIITVVSQAFCDISGYTKEELIGKPQSIVRHPDMSKEVYKNMWIELDKNLIWRGELKNLKKDGGFYWVKALISPNYDANGNKIGYTSIRQDITEKKALEECAILDKLTNLYNRFMLDDIFNKEILKTKRYNSVFSIIMIDIDHFKNVNDTYGHQIGDLVLKEISKILQDSVRKTDVVGRWGGEEFLIIFPNTDVNNIHLIAEKIRTNIEKFHFSIVGKQTVSLGVTTVIENDIQETILSRADKALYEAKEKDIDQAILKAYNYLTKKF